MLDLETFSWPLTADGGLTGKTYNYVYIYIYAYTYFSKKREGVELSPDSECEAVGLVKEDSETSAVSFNMKLFFVLICLGHFASMFAHLATSPPQQLPQLEDSGRSRCLLGASAGLLGGAGLPLCGPGPRRRGESLGSWTHSAPF